jgi:hypothetical protein
MWHLLSRAVWRREEKGAAEREWREEKGIQGMGWGSPRGGRGGWGWISEPGRAVRILNICLQRTNNSHRGSRVFGWMKIVRLLDGDPTTPLWAMGCWYGRTVGRRRVSEAVSVGRRVALATVLEGVKTAGLTVRAQDSETDVNRNHAVRAGVCL